jgi:Fe-S cluster biosynthesis and repair protein YggX
MKIELSLIQKTANAIEIANNLLVIAENNMKLMTEDDREDIQQLMDECLIEFISEEMIEECAKL